MAPDEKLLSGGLWLFVVFSLGCLPTIEQLKCLFTNCYLLLIVQSLNYKSVQNLKMAGEEAFPPQ